ncbi:MAG TPA: DUF5329 family protein, partial [Nitrospiraceae bacterium]|nr:DUF5329 family protein [Nitrospiraceae bacterium]
MKRIIFSVIAAVSSCSAFAEPDAIAKQEISELIERLASSGCRFNRNGSWYDASQALRHLNRKYEYLLKRDLVANAEAFIERAASQSSASGKPYLVKCADAPEMQSAAWFRKVLE